jgi:hypothetical protein
MATLPHAGPYRTNARSDEPRRARRKRTPRALIVSALGVPRLAAAALVASVGIPLASLNSQVRHGGSVVAPDIARYENIAIVASIITIPLLVLALRRAWRTLPGAPTMKRRNIRRAAVFQLGAVALAAFAVVGTRPSAGPVVASTESVDGRRAWVYAWEWGCGYRVGVDDGEHGVWMVGEVGPLDCKAPPPRIEWRGRDVHLRAIDGRFDMAWPVQP